MTFRRCKKFDAFDTRRCFIQLGRTCPKRVHYKPAAMLRFRPKMFLRPFRERMFDLPFYKQFHDLCEQKNAKHGREAQFENKKCENTLRIRLLLNNPIGFVSCRFSEIVKKPQGFPSKVDFRNVRNWKFFFGRP